MNPPTRREALSAFAAGGAATIVGERVALARDLLPAPADTSALAALTGSHTVAPLPFPAGKLKGISERLITSHHDNNYAAAVRSLNLVEKDLSHITGETPPFLVAALRERELTFRNSKTLHEAYFANLGGDGRRSGAIEATLTGAYGSDARWEEHFRTTGLGLGGGSGWVMLVLEIDTGALRTVGSGNHTQVLANALPLLVMDMYEHSYQMDYGAAVPRYIDAFFANIRWDEVNRRLEHGRSVVNGWGGPPATMNRGEEVLQSELVGEVALQEAIPRDAATRREKQVVVVAKVEAQSEVEPWISVSIRAAGETADRPSVPAPSTARQNYGQV